MILHVTAARYIRDYVIWVRFNDGAEGEVDLVDELVGKVFGPLKNLATFRAFRVDPLLETVVWPNDADLAPEFLRDKLKLRHYPVLTASKRAGTVAAREKSGTYGARKSTCTPRRRPKK